MQAAKTFHQHAEEAIQAFRTHEGTCRVDPRLCLVVPLNREGTLMNANRVHSLLGSIMTVGFSEIKASVGIVVDIPPERRQLVLKHNEQFTKGGDLLPEVTESQGWMYTVLHTNDFTMLCCCFLYRTKTTPANMK